jgi:hypothetical protein
MNDHQMFDGAIPSQGWKKALWAGWSWQPHEHARRQSRNTAIASFPLAAGLTVIWDKERQ